MKRSAVKRTRLLVEEFEPRILYSADAGVLANGSALAPAAEVRVLDMRALSPVDAAPPPAPAATAVDGAVAVPDAPAATATATDRETAVRHELVFVDAGVHDYRTLLNDLIANAGDGRELSVVLLDPKANGIDQITQALAAQQHAVDAIHFITHGTDGAVKLGNVWLNDQNVDAYAASIAGWQQGLAPDADLLFYGCDVADNADGRALVDALHALTGANVAASADVTGNAVLGGNWNLEYVAGNATATVVLAPGTNAAWTGVLATLTVSTTNDVVDGDTTSIAALLASKGADGNISLREAILATNNTAGADEIILPTGTYVLTLTGADDLAALGDLDIRDNLTITGAGSASTIIDGNASDRVFEVLNNSTATLTDLTIRNGSAPQAGGVQIITGSTVNLTRVVLSGNSATSQGGAIQNEGTLTLTDVRLTGNSVFNNQGGGLHNSGTATATRVTIDGNSAKFGGGIYNSGTLSLTNATISGNFSTTQNGGGIFVNAGAVTMTNVTVTNNFALLGGGGIFAAGGTTTLKNTLVAGNFAFTAADFSGTVTSAGNNLIGDTSGSSGWVASDLKNVASLLDPFLRDNGGLTPTHALLAGSLAINAGAGAGAPTTDQRGYYRSATDIGAYEFGAAAFFVDTTSDVADGNTSSIAALLASRGADGKISLREAILAANNTPGLDVISFNIGSGGLQTINIVSGGLPAITDAVFIDGTSQPGYAGVPLIELNGIGAGGGASGLYLTTGSSGSTLRGLIVNSFGKRAILIDGGSGSNLIAGNYLGTDASGLVDLGNGTWGIDIIGGGANNVIGGSSAADRNVISGNDYGGIALNGAAVVGTRIQGNYIGVGADGVTALGNGATYGGVLILNSASGALIGGTGTGEGNIIANNGGDGVEILSGSARIVGNSIYNNGGLGIDLTGDGVTANDNNDPDSGPNDLQNYPDLSSAVIAPGQITISGNLKSEILSTFTTDFYSSPTRNPSGYGEGKVWLGSYTVTTNGGGNSSFSTILNVTVNLGDWITATATNAALSTSEFSAAIATAASTINQAPAGTDKTVTMLEDANYTFSSADFGFTDPANSPANNLLNVKITTLPAAGSLKLSGVAVTAGQLVSAGNISAGNLKFTPAPNASGTGYASFTFQVQDDGGTAGGGSDLDPTPNTLTLDVTAVNDAPVGANKTVTTLEDSVYTFMVADFGYTDPSDSPANALLAVKIATLPAAGSVKLSGVAVTAGQFISAANIAAGNLTFTPAANANGTGYASFTFQVQDDGGTANGGVDLDPTQRTLTIDVTAVNDAPAGANKTVTVLEDATYTFATSDFGFTDTADSPSNTLLNVKITTLPAAGSLKLSGVAVTAGQFITAANITAGNLKFTPAANGSGADYAAFTFQVQDNGGTANGGIDLDPAPKTLTVNVTAVNDAPVGTNNTVTAFEDTAYTFSVADFGFTDPTDSPANNLLNVKITSLPGAGSLKLSGVAVINNQLISAANIAAGNLKFTPAANASGAGYASFTFKVQDDGGTANGGVDLDTAARTLTINVTAVNDAPSGANKTVTTLEDTAYTFSVADFGFTDATDSPANALLNVRITTVPGAGTLVLSGVAVTAGQFVSAANITAGNLKFTPAANANGAGYASFTFQVQDNGGTANGGVDLDPTPRTMTVNVTAVNDAPVGTNKTVTVLEGSVYTFTVADFGYTDPNDSPANALLNVKITTLPAAGSLKLSGVAVTAGQLITAANISAGNLKFTPAANGSGAGYAAFTFQVKDNGGTANGGVDLDTTPRTLTVNVTPVNDAPAGTSKTVTTLEDTAYAFTVADFGLTDMNDTPANNLLNVKISALPAAGSLKLSGVAVTAGQFVSAANITAGNLTFTPAANANGAGYASFTFQVQDDGGTANGGVDLDATPRTLTLNVTAVNDAPVRTAGTVSNFTLLEDSALTSLGLGTLAYAPGPASATDESGQTLTYTVTVVPAATLGTVTQADGITAVTASTPYTLAQLQGMKFNPLANANGGPATFAWTVQDSGGTAGGGADTLTESLTITLTAVNDAPVGTNKTVTTLEDTTYTFTVADFGFTDPADTPANVLLNVKVTTLPAAGSLKLSGVAVTAGQFISAAAITAGNLKFAPAADANGAAYAAFTFQVQDNGGTANAGVDLDATPRTMTVNVTAVNDAPVTSVPGAQAGATNTPLVFSSGGGNPITVADIDAGASPVQVKLVAADGTLTLGSTAGLTFLTGSGTGDMTVVFRGTLADINAALDGLTFDPTLNYAGSTTLAIETDDLGNTGSGGAKTNSHTIVINVSTTNTAPVLSGANNLLLTLEDSLLDPGTPVSGLIALQVSDADAGAQKGIAVTAVDNGNGAWQYTTDSGGTWSDFGTPADNAARLLAADADTFVRFKPNANWNGSVMNGITFRAWDQTSGAAGGVGNASVNGGATAFSAANASASINVLSVNDAPVGADKTVTTLEDTAYAFSAADFGCTDAADAMGMAGANALTAVKITTLPAAGTLTNNGVNVTAGQFVSVMDIDAGLLVFTPVANANGAAYATFTFQVQDDGGTANGGADLDATPRTLTVGVTAVNDAPIASGAASLAATLEDTLNPAGATVAALFGANFSDVADAGNPAHNQLAGVAVRGQSVSAAQGRWQYSTDGGGAWANFGAIPDTNALSLGVNDRLRFLPAANFNGTPTNLSVRLIDNSTAVTGGATVDASASGGATAFSAAVVTTSTLVTPVNDAPAGADKTVATLEDTAYTFTTADFGFTDADDTPANALTAVMITTLPGAGALTNNGVNVTAGQLVSVADIDAGKLKFTPAGNANGAGYASFTFQVEDNGGTADGGVDLDQTPRTMTVNVTSVNDAPVGTNKTVTVLEDAVYTFAAADFGFTDPDDAAGAGGANALLNVKIATVPGAGALKLSGVAVTAGDFVPVVDINAGNLKFTPAANANGAAYASFTFQAQDDGGVANGAIDLDATPRTLTVNVTSVNDAPAGANKTVTTLEDIAYTFTAADFGFTDPLDSPADALFCLKITTLPAAGALSVNGANLTAGQFVSITDINAGNFVFTPLANAYGAAYASFTFQVQDDGGVANGGVDLDATPRTLTVNVTALNDAPAGTDKTVTTSEDTAYTFTAADFGCTDTADTPANALLAVKITTLPTAGTLRNNGVLVTGGQFVSVADLDTGKLLFTSAANGNGAGYASFLFQVRDDGGTANGGVDLDTTPRTMTVDVTSVNDAPAGASKTITTLEDTAYTFTATDFGFSDAADAAGAAGANALLAVKITTLPVAGTLQDNGVNVTAGQFVSVADINAGKLVFTPAANANGAGYGSFAFQVQDDGGVANGGVDLDATPRTLTVNVTAVNDAPVGTSNTVTTLEDTAYTFTAADFGYTDPADAAGASGANALTAVKITALPAAGVLKNSGVNVTAGQFVSVADLNAGKLVFTPAANGSGAAYATFTFQVQDNGGTASGGINLDPVARSMTIAVTAVNDPPVISGLAGGVTEALVNVTTSGNQTEPAVAMSASGSYAVVWTSDGGQDGNGKGVFARLFDSAGNARSAEIRVNTYFTSDQTQPAVAMAPSGEFVVVWSSNGQDGNSTGVYGQRFDAAGNKVGGEFHVSVTTAGKQEQPAIAMAADGSFVVAWSSDNGATTKDIFLRRYDAAGVAIGGEVPANTVLSEDQIQPSVGVDAAGDFVITWKTLDAVSGAGKGVSAQRFDSAGVALGGEFLVNTFVTGDQDKPIVAVAPDGRFVIAWSSNGQDGSGRGIYAQRYTALGAPAGGEFRVNTTTANTQDASSVAIDGAGNFVIAWASKSQDGSGKGIYAQRFDAAGMKLGAEYRVNKTTANNQDQPAIALSPGGDLVAVWQGNGPGDTSGVFMRLDRGVAWMNEDGTLVFSTANGNRVSVADVDGGVVQATLSATDGVVTLSGTAGLAFSVGDGTANATMTFTGTLAAINAALDGMRYVPAPNFNGPATLTLAVDDLGNTGLGGALVASNAIAISVIAVNDAPAGTSDTVTVTQNTTYSFVASEFGFTDPNDTSGHTLLAVRITTLPGAGSLTNDGVAVTAGQFVSVADIDAGKLAYTPALNAFGAAYAQFTFQVQDDGGTANGGVDLDATPRVMTLDVLGTNNAPVLTGANDLTTINEDAAGNGGTLVSALIAGRVTDPDAGAARGIAVTAVDDSNGVWEYSLDSGAVWTAFGIPSDASARLLATDSDTYVRFVPNANWHGSVVSGITFRAWDQVAGVPGAVADATVTGGNSTFSAATAGSSITVNSVNDVPAGADNTVTTLEDTAYTFSVADFGLTDARDAPANNLLAVQISALPVAGTLQNNGVDVNAGQFVTAADIGAGRLMFIPAANANGAGYATFTFRVQDDGGVANGGVDLEAALHSMTMNVIAVNDAPAGASKTVTTLESISYVFSVADFGFTDTNDAIADAFAAVRITTLPGAGTLSVNGVAATAGQFVSVAQIVTGRLVFTPATGGSGNGYATFTFQVQDSGGTANGGVDLDPAPKAVTVNVIGTSTGPVLAPPAPMVVPVVTVTPAIVPAATTPPAPVTAAASVPARSASSADTVAPPAASAADSAAESRARGDAGAAAGGPGGAGSAPSGGLALKGPGLIELQWINVASGDQPALLGAAGANTLADFKLAQAVTSAMQQPAFERALDKAREGAQEQVEREERVVSSAIMGSTGLSVGYLVWLLRSGALISSLLSSLPAWRTLDPFPVLSQLGEEEEDEDDDSLEALVAKNSGAPAAPKAAGDA